MKLAEFVRSVPGYAEKTQTDQVKLLAWFLHTHRNVERFEPKHIRDCFDELHLAPPSNMSQCFANLQGKKPAELLKDSKGYRFEARVRAALDRQFGVR
jgi:hypothetical protein